MLAGLKYSNSCFNPHKTVYRHTAYEMKDEIWSEEAESHAYETGQVIKCLITKIQNSGRQFSKMNIPPYLSRESSKVDEIWYTNTNFDTAEET